MEFNFNEIVQIIQIIVAIVPLFLAYYFFKKQYKFKTSHDRVVKVNDKMSELTSDLDNFVFSIGSRRNDEEDLKELEKILEKYQKFNLYKEPTFIFLDKKSEEYFLKWRKYFTFVSWKMKNCLNKKIKEKNDDYGSEFYDEVISPKNDNLKEILKEFQKTIKSHIV